jgi:hypothetical protein
MDISPSYPPTQPGEAILPNVFLKQIQLPHRIRSTNTAIARATAATAGALLSYRVRLAGLRLWLCW